MKTKLFVPLFVILIMGMTTSAFAQLNCAVASGTISRATITGHAEPAGDISFTCTAPAGASAIGAASITVGYPVPITDNSVYPATFFIRITDLGGSFGVAGQIPTVAAVNNTTNQVVIAIPTQVGGTPGSGSFTLRGVLVSLASTTASSSLQAQVSASPPQTTGANVLINSGDNTPTVITSIMPGISTTTPPAVVGQSALYLSGGTNVVAARRGFAVTVTEGYIDMFRTAPQMASNGATNSTTLTYTFSGMTSLTSITNCVPTFNTAGVLVAVSGGGTATASSTGTTATLTVSFTGTTPADSPSQTAIETVTLTCGSTTTDSFSVGTSTATSFAGPITATVTLSPTGSALGTGNVVLTGTTAGTGTGLIPRYASTPISFGTVVTFTPATTTFLLPYAVVTGGTSGYNTGVAIANTTANPASFGTVALGGATAQAGTITFTLFPSDGGASTSVTTASVPSGGSFIANVSDLMAAATPPRTGDFYGYVIAVANFTNGHGAAFVYGGASAFRVSSTTEVLVLASPAIQPRSGSPTGFPLVEYTTK